ncbi:TRAP transporter small permease subunit [Marinobacterium sp. D7]|uniref:TRAP transporter small permease subunit n=1 Tax=Marinobacterium ramblicola TaxID=2849041 RepID=UPI001C2D5433|nr:TRAP transporter small permease subunit [Marinobacterium ramblicola]MBV1787690.1 TRAP transporter small permease subunit [Marinobacterium ramblicola]
MKAQQRIREEEAHEVEQHGRTRLDRCILQVGNLLSLLFVFTVAISFFEILMRYLFNAPTIWVHESAAFIGGSLFVIGGAYALANDKHVRVVLIYDQVSPRVRCYLDIFHALAGLLFTGMLAYGAWMMMTSAWLSPLGELHLESSGSAWNPPFPALLKALILLVVCVMFVQFLLHLIDDFRRLGRLKRGGKLDV